MNSLGRMSDSLPNSPTFAAAPTLHVGSLSAAHRTRVAAILASAGDFRDDEIDVALELFDESFLSPDYELVGVFDGEGELAGFACYGPTPSCDRTFDLYWIVVHREAQGSGAGTALLDEVESRLRERAGGARLLVVETSSRSEYDDARRFYGRRGYREAARVPGFYADGDDRITFTKRLTGSDREPGATLQ
jgi:ribosomal protein S18 acetylase RimI-like enzyme